MPPKKKEPDYIKNITSQIHKDCASNTEHVIRNPAPEDPPKMNEADKKAAMAAGTYLLIDHWCNWVIGCIRRGEQW